MKVTLIAAITADGFIAKHDRHAADWTSKDDKRHFAELTKSIGVMVMGSTTFDTIGRALPGRRMIVMTTRPEAYALPDIETFQGGAAELIEKLEAEGAPGLAVIGGGKVYGQFMLANVVDELFLTVEPRLFGTGVSLLHEACERSLRLVDVSRLGEQGALLHYEVER